MAQIEPGPIVTNIRGSIRGTTFSWVRSGLTARGKPRPPLPYLPSQRLTQSRLAASALLWRNQPADVKQDWKDYAATVTLMNRLNLPFHPTGQQMYIRSAMFNKAIGLPLLPILPTDVGLCNAPIPVLDMNATNLRVGSWDIAPVDGLDLLTVAYTGQVSTYGPRGFYAESTVTVTPFTPPFIVYTAAETKVPSGRSITWWVKFQLMDTYFRVSNYGWYSYTETTP
jgi:hypothetical protein